MYTTNDLRGFHEGWQLAACSLQLRHIYVLNALAQHRTHTPLPQFTESWC
jgi:hypothetical protein